MYEKWKNISQYINAPKKFELLEKRVESWEKGCIRI